MASAKDKPQKDELATTSENTATTEIPSRAAKRAGKSTFVVAALGAVKFEGRFYGPGATLDLTEEQAADFGASVEPKKDDAK